MFDGHFDPAFHAAFHAQDAEDKALPMSGWLTALTVAASVSLLGAVWLITATPELATEQPAG